MPTDRRILKINIPKKQKIVLLNVLFTEFNYSLLDFLLLFLSYNSSYMNLQLIHTNYKCITKTIKKILNDS